MKNKPNKRNFIGLKRCSHAQRTRIIKQRIIPILKKELGNNLIAIAADGSYARNQDTHFSDIELMIFVKEKKKLPFGFSRIINGVLAEGIYLTEKEYYKSTIEPNECWFVSGSDTLKPIINRHFINKVSAYEVKDLENKCMKYAKHMSPEIQEAFAKVFTAIEKNNRENIFVLLSDCVMSVLKLMSFINRTPYTTLATFISQAKRFKIKPHGFDQFVDIVVKGKYIDLAILDKHATVLFQGIEDILKREIGANIYNDDLATITKKRQNI